MPFVPGGGTDSQARLLGKKFQEYTGQTLIVDNRPGAGGLIGAEMVTRSPPDGYTVLLTTTSIAINLSLQKKIPFDPFLPAGVSKDIVARLHALVVKGLNSKSSATRK